MFHIEAGEDAMKRFGAISMLLLVLAPATALAGGDFVVVRQKIDAVMQPKSPMDAFAECAKNEACTGIVDAAASYFGAPPGTVAAAFALVPKAERRGEEGYFSVNLPDGYAYCRARIETVSVVPATGDRASVMGVNSTESGVDIYTWTPVQGPFDGRSWVEADITLQGARRELVAGLRARGICRSPGQELMNCRGATGTNKGMPACGTRDD